MSRRARIAQELGTHLAPSYLKLVDNSKQHHLHRQNPGGEETHIALFITSDALTDLSRVQAHRTVQKLLQAEFDAGLHSLTIEVIKN